MTTQWDPKAKAALRQVARYINMIGFWDTRMDDEDQARKVF